MDALPRVGSTYLVATGVGAAWLAWGPDTNLLVDALVADLLATLVVFVASRLHHNSSFYDAYWSVAPPLLVGYWWAGSSDVTPERALLLMLVVALWAVRLTWNWASGFPGLHHEDWRYPLLRERAGRWELLVDLFAIHVFPTLQVFLALLPAYVALTRGHSDVGVLDVIATLVGISAVAIELVADRQLRAFVARRTSGQVMDHGLWGWSRHPNYFGEVTFWFSLLLFGLAASPGDWWWLWVGVAAMLAMFLGASIPMMEERSLQRRPGYQDVIDRVSKLVPLPPRPSPHPSSRP